MQIESLGRDGVSKLVILVGMLALGACSSSSDNSSPAPSAGSGGGAAGSTGLPAQTAGKACSVDADCGHGSCDHQLPDTNIINALLGTTMSNAPGGYCTTGCFSSTECGAGGTCIGATTNANGANGTRGLCYAACGAPTDCRDGYRCTDSLGTPITTATTTPVGTCQVAPATVKLAPGVVGNACTADTDCGGGTCTMTGVGATFPDGYCTGSCLADSDCGSTGVCAGIIGGGAGTCYRKCDADTDCARDGYRCRAPVTFGMAADPNAPKQCVAGAKPLADGIVGSACLAEGDCGGAAMSCRTTTSPVRGTAFPGGYCTQACADDSDCGAGGVCTGGFAGVATGTCYKSCTTSSECRTDYTCGPPPSAFGAGGNATGATVCGPTPTTGEDAGVP
jgi:hypothetical protein